MKNEIWLFIVYFIYAMILISLLLMVQYAWESMP